MVVQKFFCFDYLNSLFQQNPLPPLLCFSKGGSLGFLLPPEV